MHNHHIRNPLLRTFSKNEVETLENKKQLELRHELIQERFNCYKVISLNPAAAKNLHKEASPNNQYICY